MAAGGKSPRARSALAIAAALILIALVIFLRLGRNLPLRAPRLPVPAATAAPPPRAAGATWIARLNYYRVLSGLDKVAEDPELSRADLAHARYLVSNEAGAIRSGKIGPSLHTEDPARPLFTAAGKSAAEVSAVDAVFSDPPEDPDPPWAIENWITGPFHRLWLLNPALARAGYGQFCKDGICAAALNVRTGIADPAPDSKPERPVMFPPAQATIHNAAFTADESEWPDPLAPCAEYENPTGIPITLALGRPASMRLEEYRVESGGAPVAACGFDADSYRSHDQVARDRVRRELTHFGAIVIVPRRPLEPGAAYSVSIKASGTSYSWWFAVAP